MKFLKHSFIAQILIILVRLRDVYSQAANSRLITHAQTVDDLRYVIGPNYKSFIAGYWWFLYTSCEQLATRLNEDLQNGLLGKYCGVLNPCPELYSTQSCTVQLAAYATLLACCEELSQKTTTVAQSMTTQLPTDISKTVSTSFSLIDQQTCNYGRNFHPTKIFGGMETIPGEFPWTAMVLKNGFYICVCVILDAFHALTAAHCFDSHSESDRYEVIAGKYRFSLSVKDPTEQRVAVASFVSHQLHNRDTYSNDIAMLRLAQPLNFSSSILPACLPSPTDKLEGYCTVAGWGQTENGEPPSVLLKIDVQVYNRTQCYQEFKDTAMDLNKYLLEGTICAANGKLGQKDSCRGDSGGPLMLPKTTNTSTALFVFGIVSNGNNCAVPGEPGLYVNIQFYLNWINTTIYSVF